MSAAALQPTPAERAFRESFEALPGRGAGREAAWRAFERTGLPHKRIEEWKWSDVRQALREPRRSSDPLESYPPGAFFGQDAVAEIVFANGRLAAEPDLPHGARLVRLEDADAPEAGADYPLAALASALTLETGAYVLEIEGELDTPIGLRFVSAGEGAHHLRLAVRLTPGARARLLESHEGLGAAYANIFVEAEIAPEARLDRYVIQSGGEDSVRTATTIARLGDRAAFNQCVLALGGALTRFDSRIECAGPDTSVRLDGAYLLHERRHADLTSIVEHQATGGVTAQVVKGVVGDRARGAFQGRFDVARGAQKTDAEMQHHALLLNEGAQSNAKPELMIFADDVECAHGNTVGALDEDALFYMRARGIAEAEARALLIEAFISEAFAHTPETIQEEFIAQSRARLEKIL